MLSANAMNGNRKIKKLIETWVRFGDFLKTSLGQEGVQRAQEEGFLRLKAKIAHLLPVLTVVERGRALDPEALAAVRDITEMLNSFTTLATPEPLTSAETEEIIARWHRIFIFLNKLEGALRDRRYGFMLRPGEERREQGASVGVLANSFVRFMISLVIIVACIALIAGLLGITLDQAVGTFKKSVAVVLGEGPVSTTGVVGSQAPDSVKTVASGSDLKTETSPNKAGQPTFVRPKLTREHMEGRGVVPTALQPLLRQYGRHLTMVVFAIFLAGLVFLFFLRIK